MAATRTDEVKARTAVADLAVDARLPEVAPEARLEAEDEVILHVALEAPALAAAPLHLPNAAVHPALPPVPFLHPNVAGCTLCTWC